MQRRIWVLVAALTTAVVMVGTGAATSSASPQVLRAAPFNAAAIPRTPAARAVSHQLTFGMEQDVSGFNSLNANENQYWAVLTGETPVIRGNYIVDNKGLYHLDLASKVVVAKTGLTITIRPDAYWYWQGHAKAPVTVNDYIYTYQQIVNPNNNVASTTGYSNITGYQVVNDHQITFKWNVPFADYRDLFGFILPKAAFQGISGGFNSAWTNCVCGSDGNPVSDGPYYLDAYTVGQGVTIKATPSTYWYGTNPSLTTVNFKLITDQGSEFQAYNGGEIDAMAPAPNPQLAQYTSKNGTVFSVLPGFTQEHLDINLKGDSGGSPNGSLLGNYWLRQAIMEGINRQGIINAVFSGIATGLHPLNNPVYNLGKNANGKFGYMGKYNYAPAKAISLLKAHGCTGGPNKPSNSNSSIWTCGGKSTSFNFKTTTRATRTTSSAIIKANLLAIGININVSQIPAGTFFGTITPNKAFDIAEYAWIGGVDPSGFDAIYQCQKGNQGGQNYKNYCNPAVDALIVKGDKELNAKTRTGYYQGMARLVSQDVPVIPLYGPPNYLIYNNQLGGMSTANNPTSSGPTWNIETWFWKS
jgi:peptide/nickel transport system substrate-binding protein